MHSCAIYVSSGVAAVASRVAAVAAAVPRVAVVDVFTDVAYSRSSVKLVAEPAALLSAAHAAALEALTLVDLSEQPHPAPHPRCGAVDMISFMPLSEASGAAIADDLGTCDELAWSLGRSLGETGAPVLMYGPRAGRTLVEARRGTSFFASCKANAPREAWATLPLDFGSRRARGAAAVTAVDAEPAASVAAPADVPQRTGVAVVGVQTYVTNFNIQVDGASLEECKAAASALRAALGVQVMALPHTSSGSCEIGCNLQASHDRDSPAHDAVLSVVASGLPAAASIRHHYVIGLTPAQALEKAQQSLAAS